MPPPPLKKHLRSSLERRFRCFDFEWDRAIECCEISRRACWGGAVARWRPCRGMDTRGLGTRPVRPLRYTRRPAETDDLWLSKWTRDRRTAEQPTRLNSSASSNVVDRSSPFSRTPTASRLDDTVFLAHCSLSSAPHFLAMNLQVTAAGWQRRLRGVGVFFAAVAAHTCRGLWKRHPRAAPSRPISSAYRRCLNRPLTFCAYRSVVDCLTWKTSKEMDLQLLQALADPRDAEAQSQVSQRGFPVASSWFLFTGLLFYSSECRQAVMRCQQDDWVCSYW